MALESGDMNTAGMAMFRIKPKSEGVRAYWAQELPASMTAEEAQNYNLAAVVEFIHTATLLHEMAHLWQQHLVLLLLRPQQQKHLVAP